MKRAAIAPKKTVAAEPSPGGISGWFNAWIDGWNRFWFTPRTVETLAALRIATGAMLLYTHLVLASDLMSFVGPDAWINNEVASSLHQGGFGVTDGGWSYLWLIESPGLLWAHQILAIVVAACFMLGFCTRVTAPLSWFIQLMFMHRLTGALYGLDQVTTMMNTYLMLAPCGAMWSLDAKLRKRLVEKTARVSSQAWNWFFPAPTASTAATVATRLLQLHVCVIYLFGGLWKARGEMWWDGTAMWFAAANYEYQSNDMTWLASYPVLFATLTHATVFWETFYPALVWPRLTRPIVLGMAVMVHGGIAIYLGMITFGTMMIVANASFLEPEFFRRSSSGRGHESLNR